MEFHQHIAILDLASSEEMSYVKYSPFHLFVSAYIGMQNMREVFPGMSRVTVENVLPADLVFRPVSAPLQYTCSHWQERLPFLLRRLRQGRLCLGRRSSPLDDLIRLGLLLLTVKTVCVLIAPLPAHLQPRATLSTLSHLEPQTQMLYLLLFPLHSFRARQWDLSLSSSKSSSFSSLFHPQLHLCWPTANLPE